MDYFAELIDDALIERDITRHGKTVKTYWKPMTAGQRVSLLRGQVVKLEGGGVQEVNLSDNLERSQKQVALMLCDSEGKPVYASVTELQKKPSWLVEALVRIAGEVSASLDEGKSSMSETDGTDS